MTAPEPPREDQEHDDLADVPLEDRSTWAKRRAVTTRPAEAERGAEHCYFEGCPDWITGSSDYCPTHAKLYAPVPASQSVPAVPVSSTGGKETGEAAETATEALSIRWYPVMDDTIGGWAIANVDLPVSQLDTRDRKLFTVGDFLSEEIARHICELHNAALSLPDSETEWGERSKITGRAFVTSEQDARDRVQQFPSELELVQREVGPWTEVTS